MNGYPDGYCEKGTHLRVAETDSRAFMEEARRKAATWHNRLKAARAKLLDHRQGCACCAAVPVVNPGVRS